MNKQVITVGLLAVLLASATQGFAQKLPVKKLNPAQVERVVTQNISRLAPRVPGVYIPAGTTVYALEEKIAQVAQKANIKLTENDAYFIATHPEALRQFQVQTNMAVFEGRPLPVQEGLKVLKANQENFAQARANGEYETAWEAFMQKKEAQDTDNFILSGKDKTYIDTYELADDVYNFYKFNNMDLTNCPRVRSTWTQHENIVLEIPVNGLKFLPSRNEVASIDPTKYVVMHGDERNFIVHREMFEKDTEGYVTYRVIQ